MAKARDEDMTFTAASQPDKKRPQLNLGEPGKEIKTAGNKT